MSGNEEKYSAYIESHSMSSLTWSLFAGFTFAAITILLTQHPEPSQIPVQITLFIFAFMLFLFLHNLSFSSVITGICIRTAPPLPEKWRSARFRSIQNSFTWIGWILMGYSVVSMYLLWGLCYLAFASSVLGLLFLARGYVDYIKPSEEHFRKHPFIRK